MIVCFVVDLFLFVCLLYWCCFVVVCCCCCFGGRGGGVFVVVCLFVRFVLFLHVQFFSGPPDPTVEVATIVKSQTSDLNP